MRNRRADDDVLSVLTITTPTADPCHFLDAIEHSLGRLRALSADVTTAPLVVQLGYVGLLEHVVLHLLVCGGALGDGGGGLEVPDFWVQYHLIAPHRVACTAGATPRTWWTQALCHYYDYPNGAAVGNRVLAALRECLELVPPAWAQDQWTTQAQWRELEARRLLVLLVLARHGSGSVALPSAGDGQPPLRVLAVHRLAPSAPQPQGGLRLQPDVLRTLVALVQHAVGYASRNKKSPFGLIMSIVEACEQAMWALASEVSDGTGLVRLSSHWRWLPTPPPVVPGNQRPAPKCKKKLQWSSSTLQTSTQTTAGWKATKHLSSKVVGADAAVDGRVGVGVDGVDVADAVRTDGKRGLEYLVVFLFL